MTRNGDAHQRALVCFTVSDDFVNVLANIPASVDGFKEDDADASSATVDDRSCDGRADLQLPV